MIKYREAEMSDIDLLVKERFILLKLFDDVEFGEDAVNKTRQFYQDKMLTNDCYTILGYDEEALIATGSVYFYDTLPSNNNPLGVVGYITNIWVHDNYRRQKIASNIIEQLLDFSKGKCGMLALSASLDGSKVYLNKGFKIKDNYMIKVWQD